MTATSTNAVSLRSLRSKWPQQAPQANPLQAGNFGHVLSVRWANERGTHQNISRARLRILRKPSDVEPVGGWH